MSIEKEETLRLFIPNDSAIYRYYFGEFSLDKKYHSPIKGREDSTPSFEISYSKKGNLYWKDYGMANQEFCDGIGFVMERHGLCREDAIGKVYKDLVVDGGYYKEGVRDKVDFSRPKDFSFKTRDFKDWELEYWKSLEVGRQRLRKFGITALEKMYVNGYELFGSEKGTPIYHYNFGKNEDGLMFKTYSPLEKNKEDKFFGLNNGNVLEGWEQLPSSSDTFILTKSLKDVAVLDVAGYPSCSPSSENSYHVVVEKKDEIDRRFKNKFIFFDNDEAGIESAKTLKRLTGWTPFTLPKKLSKDSSDLVMKDRSYYRLNKFLWEKTK